LDTPGLSIDWLALAAITITTLVMFLLARRLMRGMNQQDWILLRQARTRGVDISREQNVGFVVFAATRETADELAALMAKDGFEIGIKQAEIQYARNKRQPGTPQAGWLITGSRVTRLLPEELTKTRQFLNEIALERKAAYLGWQVGVGSPQPPATEAARQEPT
jgi:hypothetical protein